MKHQTEQTEQCQHVSLSTNDGTFWDLCRFRRQVLRKDPPPWPPPPSHDASALGTLPRPAAPGAPLSVAGTAGTAEAGVVGVVAQPGVHYEVTVGQVGLVHALRWHAHLRILNWGSGLGGGGGRREGMGGKIMTFTLHLDRKSTRLNSTHL